MTTLGSAVTAATAIRSVADVLQPLHTLEGEGYPVRRAFPTPQIPFLDPFLTVDQAGPAHLGPGEAKGAPDRPYRGFETLTYVLEGALECADSTGSHAALAPGDVHRLTAAAGVVHSVEPTPALLEAGGLQHHLQLWVNVPAAHKGARPRAEHLAADRIPVVRRLDGSWFKVIAGTALGVAGPVGTPTPVTVVHACLAPGESARLPAPAGWNTAVYVLSGSGAVGTAEVFDGDLAVLADDGGAVRLAGGPVGADLLFLSGLPIGEPVVRSGPFVMNSAEEIEQAFDDYACDRLGRYDS
ncbi:pirin family protein [Streptomyces sp. 2P-4]|uniref:pirin family protein n=1 Tax=Streptomyces sp. 2P-4 TaxID=2931974 RepID=UPI00253FEDCC|nr:pirin family protein [Streptomyces sp. 2P-4]